VGKKRKFLCIECLLNSPEAERENPKWIFSLFDYRHPPIKKAIWFLKYKGKKILLAFLPKLCRGRILEEIADLSMLENFREPILIPIPSPQKKTRKRIQSS